MDQFEKNLEKLDLQSLLALQSVLAQRAVQLAFQAETEKQLKNKLHVPKPSVITL